MTHFIEGNQIKLLRNGAEYFPALEAAIDGAVKVSGKVPSLDEAKKLLS